MVIQIPEKSTIYKTELPFHEEKHDLDYQNCKYTLLLATLINISNNLDKLKHNEILNCKLLQD